MCCRKCIVETALGIQGENFLDKFFFEIKRNTEETEEKERELEEVWSIELYREEEG